MESIYTVYFNDGSDVIPLRFTNGFTHTDDIFQDIAQEFVTKRFPETPLSIRKYDETLVFSAALKADITFPFGIAFAKKNHEACVYEKTRSVGTVYNTYFVRYLGKIGVMSQQQATPEHQRLLIDTLRSQIILKDSLLSQQDLMMKRLECENKRLETMLDIAREEVKGYKCDSPNWNYPNYISSLNMTAEVYDIPSAPEPPKVERKMSELQIKQNTLVKPLMGELIEAIRNRNPKTRSRKVKNLNVDKELDDIIMEIDKMNGKF